MAETRQFAAVHYFAMLDGKSNGGTRPKGDIRAGAESWPGGTDAEYGGHHCHDATLPQHPEYHLRDWMLGDCPSPKHRLDVLGDT